MIVPEQESTRESTAQTDYRRWSVSIGCAPAASRRTRGRTCSTFEDRAERVAVRRPSFWPTARRADQMADDTVQNEILRWGAASLINALIASGMPRADGIAF